MNNKHLCLLALGAALSLGPAPCLLSQAWTPLLHGKDLSKWKVQGSKSSVSLSDDALAIVPPKAGSTSLVTKATYGDFILEFEFLPRGDARSCLFFRSPGEVSAQGGEGYAFVIDSSEEGWSGGISDGRRGELYPLTLNPDAKTALRKDLWNKARIEASGHSIRTWVNSVPCASIWDDSFDEGRIVIPQGDVLWRDVRIFQGDLSPFLSPADLTWEQDCIDNALSPWEERGHWTLLWDGKGTSGWRGENSLEFPSEGWKIEDGVLTAEASPFGIVTEELLHHYIVRVDFRLEEGSVGEISYIVDPEQAKGGAPAQGCRYVLRSGNAPEDRESVSALGSLIAPSITSDFKEDGWNTAMIVVNANRVEHWLNGRRVLWYERNTPMWNALVQGSTYRDIPSYGNIKDGHLLLRATSGVVHFKNFRYKELRKYPIQ